MKKLLNKLHESLSLRIVTVIIVSIVISFIINFILISNGYSSVKISGQGFYEASVFGIPIYQIVKNGDNYVGTAVGANMSIVGVILSFSMVIIIELIIAIYDRVKRKR